MAATTTRPSIGACVIGCATSPRRVDDFRKARWYAVRPAANRKPATYRCPFCGGLLPALSEHMLVLPEGDSARRRHAHTACVAGARRTGRLPLREEVEPRAPGLLARGAGRLGRYLGGRARGR